MVGHARYASNKCEVTRVAVSDRARGIIEKIYKALAGIDIRQIADYPCLWLASRRRYLRAGRRAAPARWFVMGDGSAVTRVPPFLPKVSS